MHLVRVTHRGFCAGIVVEGVGHAARVVRCAPILRRWFARDPRTGVKDLKRDGANIEFVRLA